jgi:hypothetical protein
MKSKFSIFISLFLISNTTILSQNLTISYLDKAIDKSLNNLAMELTENQGFNSIGENTFVFEKNGKQQCMLTMCHSKLGNKHLSLGSLIENNSNFLKLNTELKTKLKKIDFFFSDLHNCYFSVYMSPRGNFIYTNSNGGHLSIFKARLSKSTFDQNFICN